MAETQFDEKLEIIGRVAGKMFPQFGKTSKGIMMGFMLSRLSDDSECGCIPGDTGGQPGTLDSGQQAG